MNAANGTITNTINISTAAAFTPNIKIRFLWEGNTHYYWMIDDFTIIEGPKNDLELREPRVEFNTTYTYNPFYGQIPYDLFTPLQISGVNANVGCNTLTNVRLEGEFIHVADPQCIPGLRSIFNTSSPFLTLANFQTDNAVGSIPNFVPTILGEFQVNLLADSDSLGENPGNETYSQRFAIGDTLLAREDNGYGGGIRTGSYIRNGQTSSQLAGDKLGLLYVIESRTGNGGLSKTPTSIKFAVSDDPNNIGVGISPKIWEYDEDSLLGQTGSVAAAFGAEVASSFIPYTFNVIDTLITIPLDNGSAVINGLDSGQYVVGWEVTNTHGGNNFEVYEDASSGQFQPLVACFINLAHQPG